jgi:DNA-binding response OmpR family regulator
MVLVIDDDDPTREALQASLGALGYRVVGVSDGEAAMKIVETDPPAAIVLDLYMPGMDGFEVMSALKKTATGVPVVVISGGMPGRPGDLLPLALDLGAAAILRKPFPIEELDKIIRRVVPGRPGSDAS